MDAQQHAALLAEPARQRGVVGTRVLQIVGIEARCRRRRGFGRRRGRRFRPAWRAAAGTAGASAAASAAGAAITVSRAATRVGVGRGGGVASGLAGSGVGGRVSAGSVLGASNGASETLIAATLGSLWWAARGVTSSTATPAWAVIATRGTEGAAQWSR